VNLHLHSITMDAADPPAIAAFWSKFTGYDVEFAHEFFAQVTGDGSVGPRFMFIKVPEGKTAKNRAHVDFGTPDLEAEVTRVLDRLSGRARFARRSARAWRSGDGRSPPPSSVDGSSS